MAGGCTGAADGRDGAWPVLAVEEEALPVDLNARTSRDISRQVRSSVLLDSPPVVAKAMQCCLSAGEKVGHACFNCSRTACSLCMHCSKVVLMPTSAGLEAD